MRDELLPPRCQKVYYAAMIAAEAVPRAPRDAALIDAIRDYADARFHERHDTCCAPLFYCCLCRHAAARLFCFVDAAALFAVMLFMMPPDYAAPAAATAISLCVTRFCAPLRRHALLRQP